MKVLIRDLRRRCDNPHCNADATKEVNLPVLADYMAIEVCDNCVGWAEKALHEHVPTDR